MLNINSSGKFFEKLVSRTKIYLVIIAILQIVICIYEPKSMTINILVFVLIVMYSYWTNTKRNAEISKHIQELTLTMDGAAKKTLINSPLPLIIVETDGNVIWRSSKFVYEFDNVKIDDTIDYLVKDIKSDIENKKYNKNNSIEKEVKIKNKTYRVLGEYVKSKKEDKKNKSEYMTILYFIDITENLKIMQKYEDEKTCVGIIMIDNYEDVIQRITNEQRPQVIAVMEKQIYDWAEQTKGLIVKADRDHFIYIFEKKYLNKIKEEKFNILDTIKEIEIEGKLQLTISISIAVDGATNHEKYKAAAAGMDIVLGRGGDQAVIKENSKFIFFGGRTQEVEKRTRVKARIVSHALEELITNAKDVMIMGHSNGDIDSMGSSLGIYRFAKSLGKDSYIVNNTYGLTLQTFMEELKKDDEYSECIMSKNDAISKITQDTLLIILDTHKNNYVEVPELLQKTSKIVIIDHHRRSTDYIENALLTFQEVYASSTAELVTEIIQYAENPVNLKTIEVESLYAGIMMDTKNFTFKTGVRTFEAAAYLRRYGIDIIKVKKWFQSDLKNYNLIADIVKESEIINNTIAISVYQKEDKDVGLICAKAADELLTISDITASFVIGQSGDKVCISGRSIGDINVQVILEKLGGGGHITIAGAQVEGMSIEEVKQELIIRINEYFSEISS